MAKGLDALRIAGWLDLLSEGQAEALLVGASYLSKPPDTTVIHQGDVDDSVYIILTGRVSLEKSFSNGDQRFVRELDQGKVFGEFSVVDPAPRSTSVRTIVHSEFVAINGSNLRTCLEQNGRLCLRIIVTLVRQIRAGDCLLDTRQPVSERLWSVLLQLARQENAVGVREGITHVSLRVKRSTLALRCGADVKTISRELSRIERYGMISRTGRAINVSTEAIRK